MAGKISWSDTIGERGMFQSNNLRDTKPQRGFKEQLRHRACPRADFASMQFAIAKTNPSR